MSDPSVHPAPLRAPEALTDASPDAGPDTGPLNSASTGDVTSPGLSTSKRRLIEHLKRRDSATAPELAAAFGLTDTALRQHLETLEVMGLVERVVMRTAGRGRPPQHWRLTMAATTLFPDGHGDFTVELIESVRDAVGDDGLMRVVHARAERQYANYLNAVPTEADLLSQVEELARIRSAEGYLAEAVADGEHVLLVEHHCPIGGAARACDGICEAELAVFRRVLGNEVSVEREAHLLMGDRRCTYRITPSTQLTPSARVTPRARIAPRTSTADAATVTRSR